jgi:hypothetical protein
MTRKGRFPGLGLCLAVVGMSGCAAKAPPSDDGFGGPVTVEVVNHNWSAINVYVMTDGTVARIAMVTSQATAEQELPLGVAAGRVRIMIDPIGSRVGYLTDWISVAPGQHIRLRVENELRLTSWTVTYRRE